MGPTWGGLDECLLVAGTTILLLAPGCSRVMSLGGGGSRIRLEEDTAHL